MPARRVRVPTMAFVLICHRGTRATHTNVSARTVSSCQHFFFSSPNQINHPAIFYLKNKYQIEFYFLSITTTSHSSNDYYYYIWPILVSTLVPISQVSAPQWQFIIFNSRRSHIDASSSSSRRRASVIRVYFWWGTLSRIPMNKNCLLSTLNKSLIEKKKGHTTHRSRPHVRILITRATAPCTFKLIYYSITDGKVLTLFVVHAMVKKKKNSRENILENRGPPPHVPAH